MKKITILLLITMLVEVSIKSANTYLIYRSTIGGSWTNTAGITNPVLVDLSTVNGGSETSLNGWVSDRSLTTPTMGTGSQFHTGDQLWIISGTYLLTDTVKIYAGVSIYGGFSGSESAVSDRTKGTNSWEFSNETILDGNATTVGIAGGSASVATIVDGLTISNCKNASNFSGGGARIDGAQTTIQNCIIKNCTTTSTAATSSGGIVLTGSAIVKDCYIHDNQTSGYGAGVTIYSDGCTLTGCKVTNNKSALFGGGVNLYSATSGVTVSNCDISNNTTTAKSGGGIIVFSTTVTNTNPITISNCTFTSNGATGTTGSGGALYLNTKVGNVINVFNCTFTSNTSALSPKSTSAGGGAIWIGAGTHNIDKCTFTNNSTTVSHGGAILVAAATATVTVSNSVFTGNTTPQYGSALMLTFSATVNNCLIYGNKGSNVVYVGTGSGVVGVLNNCTIASNTNTTGTTPVGIYLSTPTAINGAFTNCLFYNSGTNPVSSGGVAPTISYCGFESTVSQTYAEANNCIKTIASSSFVDATNNDYHLATGSTTIDAGTTITACNPDLAGVARPQGTAYDVGAYEFLDTATPVDKVTNTSFSYYIEGNNIIIKGLETGKEVAIYSVTGARVFSQKTVSCSMSITLPKGIYIVKTSSLNTKLIVK